MSQHDMTVDNGAGLAVRTSLNNALQALASQSSGASAPSPTFPCQLWGDTGTGRLRQRDSANTLWIDLGPLDSARPAPGSLLNIRVFGTPGTFTYTPTPGTNKVITGVQGACAASGGAPATGAGVSSLGAPGGAGAYAESLITSGFSGATITVGAGGTGVSGATGNNGGPSSFGALVSCPGGIGGNTAGPSGSVFEAASNNTAAPSGGNLSSAIGLRGSLTLSLAPTALFLGSPVLAKLGGLGGAATANTPSLAAKTGNNGDNGKVIVWEYA